MEKRKLKPEEVKSILLIRPHFILVGDILTVAKELKNNFPFSKIIFTGNKEKIRHRTE